MLVVTSAPTGAPAQPGIFEPAVQTFGRWFVSAPSAGKADPEKEPSPVETGYGRPVCTEPMKENVQSLTTVLTKRIPVSFSVSATKVKLARCRISCWLGAFSNFRFRSGLPGSERPKKSSPGPRVFDKLYLAANWKLCESRVLAGKISAWYRDGRLLKCVRSAIELLSGLGCMV